MAEINAVASEIVTADMAATEAPVISEDSLKKGVCDSVCDSGDKTEVAPTENGGIKETAAEETETDSAKTDIVVDTTADVTHAAGVKRKSEDALAHDDEPTGEKKVKTDDVVVPETTEVATEESNGVHNAEVATNGGEAPELAPEIVTKTVEDVNKLSEDATVEASS